MGRIRRGWELTKKSWSVIRSHPGLVRFPIYGGLLALLFGAVFMVPGAVLLSTDDGNEGALVGGILLVVVGAYLASFFVIYFNVALAAAADQALRGEVPDLHAARGVARSRIGVIASWALVSAVVSAFFAVLRDRAGALGGIASAVGAAIWSLVTFLVVPVLAFEGIGPFDAIRRSAALFRQRWGQQVTGNLAIGGIAVLVTIVAVAIGVGGIALMASGSTGGEVAGAALLLIALVIGVGAAVFASATKGVFGVALYRYVADDAAVGPFTARDLESAARAA
jgi:Family of unknown function (DUF6159)